MYYFVNQALEMSNLINWAVSLWAEAQSDWLFLCLILLIFFISWFYSSFSVDIISH